MKRGNRSLLISVIFVFSFIALVSCVAAYNGWGYGYGYGDRITLSQLAENEWANVALLFLLIFSVVLFILREAFRRSYGAAVVISIVISAIGSLGFVSYYGPFISKLGPWLLVLFIAIIALSLWRLFKGMASLIWILFAITLVWLLWARRQLCGIGALFPHEACVILDFIAIAIVIIAILAFLWWVIGKLRGGIPIGAGPRIGRAREPRVSLEERARPGFWRRTWARMRERDVDKRRRQRVKEIQRRYERFIRHRQRDLALQTTATGRAHYENLIGQYEQRRDREIARALGEARAETSAIERMAAERAARAQQITTKYDRLIRQAETIFATAERTGDRQRAQRYRKLASNLARRYNRELASL